MLMAKGLYIRPVRAPWRAICHGMFGHRRVDAKSFEAAFALTCFS